MRGSIRKGISSRRPTRRAPASRWRCATSISTCCCWSSGCGSWRRKGSLSGHIEVSSFAAVFPEQHLRFVFKDGAPLVQRPVLWTEPAAAGAVS